MAIKLTSLEQTFSTWLTLFRELHVAGFRLVSSTNNGCIGKDIDYNRQYYPLLEAVFFKT
jgi:hypothetical protein